MEKINFEYQHCKNILEVIKHIQECEGKHKQQAVYSTFHNGLTQICFGCRRIRTTL